MKTSLSVRCILLVSLIATALHKAYDNLVEFKMTQIDKECESLKEKRSAAHDTMLADMKESETVYYNLKKRAVDRANKKLHKTYLTEDKHMHITHLLLKGA